MKVEDSQVIRPDELNAVDCAICGERVELTKEGDNYSGNHCDRSYSIIPSVYMSGVRKIKSKEPAIVKSDKFTSKFKPIENPDPIAKPKPKPAEPESPPEAEPFRFKKEEFKKEEFKSEGKKPRYYP